MGFIFGSKPKAVRPPPPPPPPAIPEVGMAAARPRRARRRRGRRETFITGELVPEAIEKKKLLG